MIDRGAARAPTITSLTATNRQLGIVFTAGSAGSDAIANYEYSTDDGSSWTARSPAATTSPLVVTGLTADAAGGNWSSNSTWVGGVMPSSGDHVFIPSGATVTLDTTVAVVDVTLVTTNAADALTVNGDATFDGGYTSGRLTAGTLTRATPVTGALNAQFARTAGSKVSWTN